MTDQSIQAGSAGPVPPGTVEPTNFARAALATALRRLVEKRSRVTLAAARAALEEWDQ